MISLDEKVFLQLHHTVSISNNLNCHLFLREIYEDIFLPIARAGKLRDVKALHVSKRLGPSYEKPYGLSRIVVDRLFPKILSEVSEPFKATFEVMHL